MNSTGTKRIANTLGMDMDVRLWVQWVLASTVGGLVALSMAAEFPWGVGVIPSGDPANIVGYSVAWAVVVGGLLAGAVLGGVQWLLLRRRFTGDKWSPLGVWWTAASAIGFAVSFYFLWEVSGGVHGDEYAHHGLPHAVDRAETWGGLLIGAVLGVSQWLALRKHLGAKASKSAWWWVPMTALGFAGAWWVAAVTSAPMEAVLGPMTHFWGGAVFGVVFGAITGIGLAWFSRGTVFAGSL